MGDPLDEILMRAIQSEFPGRNDISEEELEFAIQKAIMGATRTRGSITGAADSGGGSRSPRLGCVACEPTVVALHRLRPSMVHIKPASSSANSPRCVRMRRDEMGVLLCGRHPSITGETRCGRVLNCDQNERCEATLNRAQADLDGDL
jgi:hypothetical protein